MKLFILILFFAASIVAKGQSSGKVLIAAASDLKFALDSIISVFKKNYSDSQVEVTYGSSGKLYEQISNDAPFDLFFSADIGYPQSLQEKGLTISEVETYGVGRIVLWCKKIDPRTAGVETLLNESITKIAIANPRHAPYGRRAEEAMKYFKVYEQVKSKLVYGENISQAAQFVTTGAADAGIVALSLALSPAMKKMNGQYYLIPATSHDQLQQGFVLLKHSQGNAFARAFKNFLMESTSRKILAYFGFESK